MTLRHLVVKARRQPKDLKIKRLELHLIYMEALFWTLFCGIAKNVKSRVLTELNIPVLNRFHVLTVLCRF